jgi:hypothetical protein
MPLKKGRSHAVVSANVKEMMRAGHPQKQAIAASLANARKYAKGGMVEDQDLEDGGMEDMPQEEYGMSGAKNESMMEMASISPDDNNRSLNEVREDGVYYPAEVENPAREQEAYSFAHALHKKALKSEMDERKYAQGGLVEAGPEEDERLHGNHPEDIADMPMSSEPWSAQPKRPVAGHKVMGNPTGSELSMEALEAIRNKKKSRRYGVYDPRNG